MNAPIKAGKTEQLLYMCEASTAETLAHLLGSKIHGATVQPFPGGRLVRRTPQLLERPGRVQRHIPVSEK